MPVRKLIVSIGALLVVITVYLYGYFQGKNSEELKNARLEISTLTATLEGFKTKQTADQLALSNLRVAESVARDELDRMRQQLSAIERMSGNNANNQLNRCLRGRIETQELAERLARAVKFCSKNHK